MSNPVNNNPFAGLFSTVHDAASFSSQHQIQPEESNTSEIDSNISKESLSEQRVQKLIAEVFGITLQQKIDFKHDKPLVYIETNSLEQAVFERLMETDLKLKLVNNISRDDNLDKHTAETRVIIYLFESFNRLKTYKMDNELMKFAEDILQIIFRNVGTALLEPDIYEGQEVYKDYLQLVNVQELTTVHSFTSGVIVQLVMCHQEDKTNEEDVITKSFRPMLKIIYNDVAESNRLIFQQYWFTNLQIFAMIEPLAQLLITYCNPQDNSGRAYANTLLGALLNLSCLPKTTDAPFEFFDKPLQESHTSVEGAVWSALTNFNEQVFKLFQLLLKCTPQIRHRILQWIGNCLHANASRGKMSHNVIGMANSSTVSDGFMLNLETVLLKLCQPFCTKANDSKILKIDPTYCAAEAKNEQECEIHAIHLKGMSSETCLIPAPEGEKRPVAETFGFITECFFFTHRALDLGHRIILDKLVKSNQDLARTQRLYNEVQNGSNSDVIDAITQRMEMEMTKYLSLRASVLWPESLSLLSKFHACTAYWLMQVNLDIPEVQETKRISYAIKEFKPVTFPLPEAVPDTLRCIPEFVVDNTVEFVCSLRRMNPNVFEEEGPNFLNPILTELIALMESPNRLYNPHLRAKLAEGLEALLPQSDDQTRQNLPSIGSFYRKQLFISHPHRLQIIPNLLKVFVSIEMTGQSVQFEQKFNYRRPMYVVMTNLWDLEEHRGTFINLAKEAEANMEAVQPPLFLRFINLLMNDAVFLLDEALTHMAQLKQMNEARENGDWKKLPLNEREQQAAFLQQIGMMARFDNILGRETIQSLRMLTTEIKSIFCHPTMVDRIASMLNYLLIQLVGPNKKNLKVKDQAEYDFNPAKLVLSICEIYINLSQSETFTLAVSQDGRSYSPQLFNLAEQVLVRIGGVSIISDLDIFAKKVEIAARQKREEDEILEGVPDEFLDPIMSTLMKDPVILPSSKIRVDRQTIARHLLSDQTDPFNRSPLTMDMLTADEDLRNRIDTWIFERKQEKSSTSASDNK